MASQYDFFMKKPLVSIVIPYFNRVDYVKVMVESIIGQTYDNWELLMIDDGSTDGARAYVDFVAQKDSRIKSCERDQNQKGAQVCRNLGMTLSKGKYILFLDSDDFLYNECLSQRVDFMELHNDIDFGVFPGIMYSGIKLGAGYHFFGVPVSGNDMFDFIMRNLPFTVVNIIYRRSSLFKYNRVWDESLISLQDADFNIQNLLSGMKYKYAKDSKIDYYVRIIGNTGSVSKVAKTPAHMNNHLYFATKIKSSLQNEYRLPFLFLIQGLFMIVNANNEIGDSLINLLPEKSIERNVMSLKSLLYRKLNSYNISFRILGWIVFPIYMLIFKLSSIKRGIMYRKYSPSLQQLEQYKSLLLS